jgi:hypothetical protein
MDVKKTCIMLAILSILFVCLYFGLRGIPDEIAAKELEYRPMGTSEVAFTIGGWGPPEREKKFEPPEWTEEDKKAEAEVDPALKHYRCPGCKRNHTKTNPGPLIYNRPAHGYRFICKDCWEKAGPDQRYIWIWRIIDQEIERDPTCEIMKYYDVLIRNARRAANGQPQQLPVYEDMRGVKEEIKEKKKLQGGDIL